jgi:hypothetical protein
MRMLHTNIPLRDCRKRQPDSRAQIGDVAELANGRLVARCLFSFGDGSGAYGCRDYSSDETLDTAPIIVSPTDWSRWMDHELNRRPAWYRPLEAKQFLSAAECEYAEFRKAYPCTAAFIELPKPPARAMLFDVGHIVYDYQRMDAKRCCSLVERHTVGDFGEHGKYDDASLTEEELFCLVEQPIVLQNKAAIASQSGAIRSRFGAVDIVTVRSPRGTRTLIRCANDD